MSAGQLALGGVVLYAIGTMLASLFSSGGQLWLLVATYGVLGGILGSFWSVMRAYSRNDLLPGVFHGAAFRYVLGVAAGAVASEVFAPGSQNVGAFVIAFSVLIFIVNGMVSRRRGQVSGDDPWDGWTLEWLTSSPPPAYNFADVPVVQSRRPLWDLKHPEDPDWKYE